MDNLFFFPKASTSKLDEAGCTCGTYMFYYKENGQDFSLRATGKSALKLNEDTETWKVESDGLCFTRMIRIEFPDKLKGPSGVVCSAAEFGVCIIWTNRTLTQMGYILPEKEYFSGGTLIYEFAHEFLPGEMQGDLTLETVLYVKTPALTPTPEEDALINEAGVTVGEIDEIAIDFGNAYMEFPIIEVKKKDQPLWWMSFSQWEDPAVDQFSEDNVCLYLNSYHSSCPKVGATIKNLDILIEIVTTSYLMIFTKISYIDSNLINRIKADSNLEPGSICKMMHYFYKSCDPALRFDSPESLQTTIHRNIERMLGGDEE